ncbi:hypothetical protein IscW_ISCW019085 [Ixodes scapularis]|uniref:Uncharacterized protein n=1 Tax=Ixodes scapularis TaxID=6945 RepID=B7PM17_IXOSC|nr:hypothetical protein IscW_ISCW019085 [Ixodes scapularis]|eukprot:XP_002434815.1 hypothetical protein IscW_ISCW019085 [Ixodes scapularis]
MWQLTMALNTPAVRRREKRPAAEMDQEIIPDGSSNFPNTSRVPAVPKAPRFQHPNASLSAPERWSRSDDPLHLSGHYGYSFAKHNDIPHKDWQQAGPSGLRTQTRTKDANMEEEAADVRANMVFYINREDGSDVCE